MVIAIAVVLLACEEDFLIFVLYDELNELLINSILFLCKRYSIDMSLLS
jgi:hypothetical protein